MSNIAQRTGERVGGLVGNLLATPVTVPLWVWSKMAALNEGKTSPTGALIARLISATQEIQRLDNELQAERDRQNAGNHDCKSALPASIPPVKEEPLPNDNAGRWRYVVCIRPRGAITAVTQYRFAHRVGCRNTKRRGSYKTDYKLFVTAKEADEWATREDLVLLACRACGRYDQLPLVWKVNRQEASLAHPGIITPAA
jgi:hypothetical protein